MPRVDYEKLSGDRMGESSESIRAREQAARDIQHRQFTNFQSTYHHSADVLCNADREGIETAVRSQASCLNKLIAGNA